MDVVRTAQMCAEFFFADKRITHAVSADQCHRSLIRYGFRNVPRRCGTIFERAEIVEIGLMQPVVERCTRNTKVPCGSGGISVVREVVQQALKTFPRLRAEAESAGLLQNFFDIAVFE